jgi:hypothetical protein
MVSKGTIEHSLANELEDALLFGDIMKYSQRPLGKSQLRIRFFSHSGNMSLFKGILPHKKHISFLKIQINL